MDQKVYKSGSSLVVVVPSDFVSTVGVKKGDTVQAVSDVEQGTITYRFSGTKQLTISRMMKRSS